MPESRDYKAYWIPTYAGMTVSCHSGVCQNPERLLNVLDTGLRWYDSKLSFWRMPESREIIKCTGYRPAPV